jgi:D-alanyl-D-alanine carboxypeptidase/D-alanyl-D-alanine-endopeptidase (penicillin-binding protein 4)
VLIIVTNALRFKTFCVLLALTSNALAADLPSGVANGLQASGIPASSVSIVVHELGASRPALTLNEHEPRNPASVMKLVTTFAALELLGPAYKWKTEAYVEGENLVLRGTGDPKLNLESFWMLLRALRGRGVREIKGDVVLDRSYFGPQPQAPLDDDTFRPYNVAPDALLVNFKSLRFVFLPQDTGVRIYAEPALPGLEIVNALKISSGSCIDGRAFRQLIGATFQPRPPRAAFTGSYPAACGEKELNVALYPAEDYVAGMIRQLWAEMGGTWTGNVREGVVTAAARLIYTHDSEPLAELVRDINKFSNNVMARQLYLTLAAETGGVPARADNARHAIRQWLTAKKIAAPELVMENGSGLSRQERLSAASTAALLHAAWASPLAPEFVSSLPLVAADGTMRKRMRGEGVAGRAHIKTGLLQDARSIAGYVVDRTGRRHAVVMFINHPRAPQAEAAFDALLAWVYDSSTTPSGSKARQRGASQPRP